MNEQIYGALAKVFAVVLLALLGWGLLRVKKDSATA